MAVCKNIRICRSKIIKGKEFRGYNASKHEYFYGFKTAAAAVHVVTTKEGIPVEFMVTAGSIHDNTSFQGMALDLPENSYLYADAAYLNEEQRELLLTFNKIKLKAATKKNSVTKDT